jgi:Flp pilus assembly protein TadG
MRRDRRIGCARGQAAVELVGLLPLLLAAGLGAFSLLGAGAAEEAAGVAAEAGAVALLQDRDPAAAARAALAGWPRADTRIRVAGRRVSVRVAPHGPLGALDDQLAATVTANAGEGETSDEGQGEAAHGGGRREAAHGGRRREAARP